MMSSLPPMTATKHCFRCYVEFNKFIHRFDFEDVSKESYVTFETILSKFKQMDQLKDMTLESHTFKYFNGNERKRRIEFNKFRLKNASKIRIFVKNVDKRCPEVPKNISKTNEKWQKMIGNDFKINLCLVKTVNKLLDCDQHFKTSPVDWQLVSAIVRSNGYQLVDSHKQFKDLIYHYLRFLKTSIFDNTFNANSLDAKQLEMFAIMDTMSLESLPVRPFIKQSLQNMRDKLAVKQTLNWLLMETVDLVDGNDNHQSLDNMKQVVTGPVFTSQSTNVNKLATSDQLSTLPKLVATKSKDAKQKPCKRPTKDRPFNQSLDYSLVTAIHNLQTTSRQTVNWSAVTESMQLLGFYGHNPSSLRQRFRQLISQYIDVMKRCDTISGAIKHLPNFLCLHNMNLSPFCKPKVYKLIKQLKAKYRVSGRP